MAKLSESLSLLDQYERYMRNRLSRTDTTVLTSRRIMAQIMRRADETFKAKAYLSLTTEALEGVLDTFDVKPGTRRNRAQVMSGFGDWAKAQGHCKVNHAKTLLRPKSGDPDPRPLTAAQVDILFRLCPDPRTNLCLALGVFQGLRCCEMARFALSWINTDGNTLTIMGKGNKRRTAPLSADVLEALELYRQDLSVKGVEFPRTGPIILTLRGRPMNAEDISKSVAKHMTGCGIASSAHKLRATFGTNAYRSTGNLEVARVALGHSDISTTRRYVPEAGLADLRAAFAAMPTRVNRNRVLDLDDLIERTA